MRKRRSGCIINVSSSGSADGHRGRLYIDIHRCSIWIEGTQFQKKPDPGGRVGENRRTLKPHVVIASLSDALRNTTAKTVVEHSIGLKPGTAVQAKKGMQASKLYPDAFEWQKGHPNVSYIHVSPQYGPQGLRVGRKYLS
jgi:hypothetical protein